MPLSSTRYQAGMCGVSPLTIPLHLVTWPVALTTYPTDCADGPAAVGQKRNASADGGTFVPDRFSFLIDGKRPPATAAQIFRAVSIFHNADGDGCRFQSQHMPFAAAASSGDEPTGNNRGRHQLDYRL